jgi:hypothetical protein
MLKNLGMLYGCAIRAALNMGGGTKGGLTLVLLPTALPITWVPVMYVMLLMYL